MTSEQPKVDTEPNGYTDIARGYVLPAMDVGALIIGTIGLLATVLYFAATVHVYAFPIGFFQQPGFPEAFDAYNNWEWPLYTAVCGVCSFVLYTIYFNDREAGDDK